MEFFTGNVLFMDSILWGVRRPQFHSNANAPYGILPVPKYNVEQESYHDVVYWSYQTAHLWAIPKRNQDLEKASFLFHLLSVYSSMPDGTMDAYFDKVLHADAADNALARATLQTVHDSITYDIFLLYNWGGFIMQLIEDLDTASTYQYSEQVTADNMAQAEKELKDLVEALKD